MTLILTKGEWQTIQKPIVDAQRREQLIEEINLKKKTKMEKSKSMTANWTNTVASLQLEREKRILDKAKKDEERKWQEYVDIEDKNLREKNEIIEKAKKIINEKKESSRIINSGLVLSNVLYERNKQVELEKNKRMKKMERELEDRRLRRDLAEEYAKETHQKRVDHEAAMQAYKKMLDDQMTTILQQRELESKQNPDDLEHMYAELAQLREKEIEQAKEQKQKLREEQQIWANLHSQYKEQKIRQDKEEEQTNSIYLDIQEKVNKQRAEIEKKLRQELIEKRSKAQEEIFLQMKNDAKREIKREEESLQRVLREREEKLDKESKERKEKKEKLRNELKAHEKEAVELAEEEAKRRLEIQRWEMLQRLAIEEGDQLWRAARIEEKKNRQKEMREALNKQWIEQERRRKQDKWEDMSAYVAERKREADELVEYCADIEQTALQSGLPMYPILAAITRVKKSIGLGEGKKEVAFLQSRVPIASVKAHTI